MDAPPAVCAARAGVEDPGYEEPIAAERRVPTADRDERASTALLLSYVEALVKRGVRSDVDVGVDQGRDRVAPGGDRGPEVDVEGTGGHEAVAARDAQVDRPHPGVARPGEHLVEPVGGDREHDP